MVEEYVTISVKTKETLVEILEDSLRLIEDMTRFAGSMSLKDYAVLNETPIKLRTMISTLKTEKGE